MSGIVGYDGAVSKIVAGPIEGFASGPTAGMPANAPLVAGGAPATPTVTPTSAPATNAANLDQCMKDCMDKAGRSTTAAAPAEKKMADFEHFSSMISDNLQGRRVYIEGMSNMGDITRDTIDASLSYILLGFVLVAALSWNSLVKEFLVYIKDKVKFGRSWMFQLFWAILATAIAVGAYIMMKHIFERDIEKIPLVGVIA